MTDASPFIFDVSRILRDGQPEQFHRVGDTPVRIGAEMIAVQPGTEITIDGIISSLGGGVLVDATITAPLNAECVRCLAGLRDDLNVHISAVFANDDDFISGDTEDLDDEDIARVIDDQVDITQAVIDEAVLSLPFNPSCETLGVACCEADTGVPEPDGISGDTDDEKIDPRWAGLAEKFADSLNDNSEESDK